MFQVSIPDNIGFTQCIYEIGNDAKTALDNFNLSSIYTSPTLEVTKDVGIFYPANIRPHRYIAAFDMDWTLSYARNSLFGQNPDDIHVIPNRYEALVQLIKSGYTIVIFTNQSTGNIKNPEKLNDKINRSNSRILNFCNKLRLPVFVFACYAREGKYRKPLKGMWDLMLKSFNMNSVEHGFYVGDAAGRPGDFASSDKDFATNIGIDFYTPEEFFPDSTPDIEFGLNLVLLVGPPGSGKSSYAKNKLVPIGYKLIESDVVGSQNLARELKKSIVDRQPIVIDALNRTLANRKKLYDLADKAGYSIKTVYFIRDGRWNKIRPKEKIVKPVVTNTYFKYLEPPEPSNTPGELFLLP